DRGPYHSQSFSVTFIHDVSQFVRDHQEIRTRASSVAMNKCLSETVRGCEQRCAHYRISEKERAAGKRSRNRNTGHDFPARFAFPSKNCQGKNYHGYQQLKAFLGQKTESQKHSCLQRFSPRTAFFSIALGQLRKCPQRGRQEQPTQSVAQKRPR